MTLAAGWGDVIWGPGETQAQSPLSYVLARKLCRGVFGTGSAKNKEQPQMPLAWFVLLSGFGHSWDSGQNIISILDNPSLTIQPATTQKCDLNQKI